MINFLATIPAKTQMTLQYVFGSILIVLAIALVVLVLKQSGKGEGLSGTLVGSASDSYYGKNQGKTLDKLLAKLTVIGSAVFVVMVIAFVVVLSMKTV